MKIAGFVGVEDTETRNNEKTSRTLAGHKGDTGQARFLAQQLRSGREGV